MYKNGIWLILILLLASCKVDYGKITSTTMSPGLNVGDIIFWDKEDQYTYGDVVFILMPDSFRVNKWEYGVYRVVALQGDTIEIKNNICVINGRMSKTRFIRKTYDTDEFLVDQTEEELFNGTKIMLYIGNTDDMALPELSNTTPLVVPQNNYFVLGDNRTESIDSRYIGPVSIENIKGKVTKVIRK